jgi:predicted dehydrogenase
VNFVNPERDQSPDAFSVSWQYPDFVMTFTNAVVHDWEFGRHGNYFYGPGGSLLIHRSGYEVRPSQSAAGSPNAKGPRRVPVRERSDQDRESHTSEHARNFLDCVKSRQKPVSDLETGFYASLPTLLAVMAIREGRSFKWDDAAKKAVAV